VEGNDLHGGHGCVREGDMTRVGVSHGIVEVKLLCFRWLSPFINPFEHKFFTQKVISRSIYNLKIYTIYMYDIPFDRSFLQLSNGIRHVMPSTVRKLELTAKASMAQPVSQPALCCSGLSLCRMGFRDLLKVRPPSLLMLCGYISSSVASLLSRYMYPVLAERSFVSCSLIMWSWLMLRSGRELTKK